MELRHRLCSVSACYSTMAERAPSGWWRQLLRPVRQFWERAAVAAAAGVNLRNKRDGRAYGSLTTKPASKLNERNTTAVQRSTTQPVQCARCKSATSLLRDCYKTTCLQQRVPVPAVCQLVCLMKFSETHATHSFFLIRSALDGEWENAARHTARQVGCARKRHGGKASQ